MEFPKIIMATDYSTCSINSARYAIDLSIQSNSQLSILHAYALYYGSIPYEVVEFIKARAEIQERELAFLEHWGEKISSHSFNKLMKADPTYIVSEEYPGDAMKKAVEQEKYDLVVAGTHGHGRSGNMLLGSNAWNIIRKLEVPVLLIPPNITFEPVRKIVFAVKGIREEIPILTEFVSSFEDGPEMIILHVDTSDHSSQETEDQRRFKEEVKRIVNYKKLQIVNISAENLHTGLNTYCVNDHVNWLVMMNHKSSFLETLFFPKVNKAKKMSSRSLVPLLILPMVSQSERISRICKIIGNRTLSSTKI